MSRYIGFIFHRDNDSCIAKINVTDTYTGVKLLDNHLVDLYHPDMVASSNQYEPFVFWVRLPNPEPGRYSWQIEHNNTYNPDAAGPNYDLNYNGFLIDEDLPNGYVKKYIILIDKENEIDYNYELTGTEYIAEEYRYEVQNEQTLKLYQHVTHTGDGTTTVFKAGHSLLRCYKFIRFSTDGGLTYKYPYDISISWGSNAGYDDETINSNGEFWVEFLSAPETGAEIIIDVMPVFDHARMEFELIQSQSADYVDVCKPLALTEYVAEFKK